jgi:rhodanese-related sulfurtransferase
MVSEAGAKEVHMRISCPPTVSPCYYGVDTPRKAELIAAQMSVAEVCRYIEADSLGYLSIDGMREAATVKTESAKANTNVAAAATPQKTDAHGHADEAPRITLADAKKDFDAGNAVFIDTRAETSYKPEHIKGAINIPMEAVEAKYKEIPDRQKNHRLLFLTERTYKRRSGC